LVKRIFSGWPFSGVYWIGTSLVSGFVGVAAIGRHEWLIAAGAWVLTTYGVGNGIVAIRRGDW
jgi:hypothetical protein